MRIPYWLIFLSYLLSAQFLSAQKDWIPVGPFDPAELINAIATDSNGAYVAVANRGIIYFASNINDWQLIHVREINGNVTGVVYYKGKWVLVTNIGEIATSTNGIDWAVQNVSNATFDSIQIFHDSLYAIDTSRIFKSDDALEWTQLDTSSYGQKSVRYELVDGKYVAHDQWLPLDQIDEVTAFENQIAVVSGTQVFVSNDCLNWSQSNYTTSHASYEYTSPLDRNDITLVGYQGFYIISTNGTSLAHSTDLITWTEIPSPDGLIQNHEFPFLLDDRIIYFSRKHEEESIQDNGNYVSIDRFLNKKNEPYVNPIEKREYTHYTEEFQSYTDPTPPNYHEFISGPTFNLDGRIFVTSKLGALFSSTDLINWEKHIDGTASDLLDIASNGQKTVAIYENGHLLYTENGTSWRYIETDFEGDTFTVSIIGDRILVAAGTRKSATVNYSLAYTQTREYTLFQKIYYSTDATSWESISMDFKSLDVHNGLIYRVSTEDSILTSDDLISWTNPSELPSLTVPVMGSISRIDSNLSSINGSLWAETLRVSSLRNNADFGPRLSSNWYKFDETNQTWSWVYGSPISSDDYTSIRAYGFDIRVGENGLIEISAEDDLGIRSKITTFNTYGYAQEGDESMITGFVAKTTSSPVTNNVIIGGAYSLYIGDPRNRIRDPYLRFFKGNSLVASNDNADLGNGLTTTNPVLEATVSTGLYTSHFTDPEGGFMTSKIDKIPNSDLELINVSVRVNMKPDYRSFRLEFTLEGESNRKVLIRGIGPGLKIGGELTDPSIRLSSELQSFQNDDWSSVEIGNAFEEVGAFPLEIGSKDAALIATIPSGKYTVNLYDNALDGGPPLQEGIALIEVYLLED